MADRQIIIPTRPDMGRGLINHDERSKMYPATDLVPASAKPRTRTWRRGSAYDQGQTSMCVAYTGKGVLNTLLMSRAVPRKTRLAYDVNDFYAGAQRNDEWPGEGYDGSSGLGLLRYLKSIGLISEYRWSFGLDQALLTLSHVGPLGIGVMWTQDMFTPDADGFIRPTGEDAGGHEIEVTGINVPGRYVVVTNSWGTGWGLNGRAKISWDDFDSLLGNRGDAYTITG